jgi:hypothetical protein
MATLSYIHCGHAVSHVRIIRQQRSLLGIFCVLYYILLQNSRKKALITCCCGAIKTYLHLTVIESTEVGILGHEGPFFHVGPRRSRGRYGIKTEHACQGQVDILRIFIYLVVVLYRSKGACFL